MEQSETVPEPASESRRSRAGWVALIIVGFLVVVALGLYWHKHAVNGPVEAALAGETGAQTSVYRRGWIGGNNIVFDVESVDGEMSMAAMTRRLLKAAEALKDSEYDRVYLAFRGNEKFYLEGDYFKKLGAEREWQNPIYTIRTMPENVKNLDGTAAFDAWTGGWLGVLGEQLDDNNEFHRKWWVDDALANLDS